MAFSQGGCALGSRRPSDFSGPWDAGTDADSIRPVRVGASGGQGISEVLARVYLTVSQWAQ